MRRWLLACALFLGVSPSANAGWVEASSDHFVVYADQSDRSIRAYTERLERFHNAMAFRLNLRKEKPSPSNRVTIYMLSSQNAVKKLASDKSNPFLAGFYVPRAGGSVAFAQEVTDLEANVNFDEAILLHEYAHHLMYSNSAENYPLWMSEGFAEFYASVKFEKNGDISLGLPAQHRFAELAYSKEVPIERLLDTAAYKAKKNEQHDSFYGQSWALYHFLNYEPARKGQSSAYMDAIKSGQSEIDAARTAFGDLKILQKDLSKYLQRPRLMYNKLSGEALKPGPITLRALSPGEAAIMPVRLQSKRGVDAQSAAKVLTQARDIAVKFPADGAVMTALAEAEFDAGNDKEAISAADKAAAINPKDTNAIIQKGYAMARQAKEAQDEKTAWKNVRKQFVLVNKIENDHPIPLIEYYQSYKNAGDEPTKNAVDGLEWALALAPFDAGLRWTVATQQMEDKKFAEAIATLGPLTSNPHNDKGREAAQKLLIQAKEMLAEDQKQTPAPAGKL